MPTAGAPPPPFIWRTGRLIHLETGGHQPSPWEGGLGLSGQGLEQGTRRGKKREGKAELVGIPGVSFAQFSKGDLGSDHHLHAPLHTFTGSPRQQSRNRETRQLPPHPHIQEASGSVDATL